MIDKRERREKLKAKRLDSLNSKGMRFKSERELDLYEDYYLSGELWTVLNKLEKK